ncbi:hypothetical protein [Acidiplasma sp.]|uniref:hypothetical protein n=1 Tax=Acidiplasma sp. TaxID=1872114 RepID=UPI0025894671|nr:hypothetical protein [Acidiplasma sp.]
MFTVVGSKGNLGSLLMKIFPDSYGVDVDNEEKLFNYLKKSDYAFLAIPPDQEENIINKYKFFTGFIELSSVKLRFLKFKNSIISIHPLFGPRSYGKIKDIVFINDISPPDSMGKIQNIFPDYNIISLSADKHDRLMSEILVKPYIISMISRPQNGSIKTSSYEKYLDLCSISSQESKEILYDTILMNKYTQNVIDEIQGGLDYIKNLIKNG